MRVLALVALLAPVAAAQEIELSPRLSSGQLLSIEVVQRREDRRGARREQLALRFDGTLAVGDVSGEAIALTWTRKPARLASGDPLPAHLRPVLRTTDGMAIGLRLDPRTGALTLTNGDALRPAILRRLDQARRLLRLMRRDPRETQEQLRALAGRYDSQHIEQTITADLSGLCVGYGQRVRSGGTTRGEATLRHPLDDTPLPATETLTVDAFAPDAERILLTRAASVTEAAQAELQRQLALRYGGREAIPPALRKLDARQTLRTEYEPLRGFIARARLERVSQVGDSTRTEVWEWTVRASLHK